MGRLIVMAAMLGGGWWAWQNGLVPMPQALATTSPAFETYARFAAYLEDDKYGRARRMAARGALRTVQVHELRGRRNTKLGISGRHVTKDDQKLASLGYIAGVTHEPISETPSADGSSVTVRALQRVCRDRGGCEETTHEAEICRIEDEWKVCSFRES